MAATVSKTATIRASVERVFAYRLDVFTLPQYNPDVVGLEALTNGGPNRGSMYRFRVRLNPWLSLRTTLTIADVEPPRRIVFDIASLFRAREVCTFEPAPEGTRVHFETTIRTPRGRLGHLLDRLFVVPNAERQMQNELACMKERLERLDKKGSATFKDSAAQ